MNNIKKTYLQCFSSWLSEARSLLLVTDKLELIIFKQTFLASHHLYVSRCG